MPEGGGFRTRLTGPVLGMLAVGLVLALAFSIRLYHEIELKTLDLRFRARPVLKQSDLILHVDIDDSSINSFGRWASWPRARHAQLLDILRQLGARAVIFDVDFPQPSTSEDDDAFAEAIRRTGFVLLSFRLELHQETSVEEARVAEGVRAALLEKFDLDGIALSERLKVPESAVEAKLASLKSSVARAVGWDMLQKKHKLTEETLRERLMPGSDPTVVSAETKIIPAAVDQCLSLEQVYRKSAKPWDKSAGVFRAADDVAAPLNVLARDCIGFGASNTPTDEEDGVLRRVSPFFTREGRLLPHLSIAGACWALGAGVEDVEVRPRSITITPKNDAAGSRDPVVMPLDGRGAAIVNWAGNRRTPWPDLFRHVPYGSILELDTLRENLDFNESVFRRNDQFIGGAWSEVKTQLDGLKRKGMVSQENRRALTELEHKQRAVEERMLDFLKRQTSRVSDEEAKTLSPEDREIHQQMKYDLHAIPLIWEARRSLSARQASLHGRLEELIRGRLCIVGMTASGSTDLKPTPVNPLLSGVAVHSAVINSILNRSFIREAPGWANALFIVVVGLAVSLFASFLATRRAAAASLAVLLGWTAFAYLVFSLWGWWVAMAGPLAAGFLAYAAITAYRQLTEERQKRHVRNTFQHYLSPSVVEEVLRNPDALKLGGARKELTVFFSDVVGFTPIAETLEPEDLVHLLNAYLSEMSDVILESKGYINKYEGDAIMAVFGAPLEDPEHAAAACRVALESQRRLKVFREKLLEEKRPSIRARIGINSGVMIVGNMGSRKLFDYTVMGDNVNVGARLESANKNFRTEIIIGENTWRMVRDAFDTRPLGLINVKGKSKAVGAYELLGEKGNCPPLVAKILDRYREGLKAYAERRWDDAVAAFDDCLRTNPDDHPSRAYLERSKELRSTPPEGRWDGTFDLEAK